MFDGTADQFHRLISSRTEASSPPLHLPLTFTHLASTPPPSTTNAVATTPAFPGFDLYPSSPQPQLQLQHHLDIQQPIPQFLHPLHHHQLHHSTPSHRNHYEEEEKAEEDELACIKPPPRNDKDHRPWTADEVIALFRTRSSIENWFPEVTWEHVSRKLEELGFKRSPEKCKEKFEEGSSTFYNSINNDDEAINYGKNNMRILSELEEICQGDRSRNDDGEMGDCPEAEGGETARIQSSGKNRNCIDGGGVMWRERTMRKRRRKKFEMFKRFCEEAVEKLMFQQEEMHNKLLEDLARRDGAMVAREEEQKKREMDRINKELDEIANEQAIAGDRQAAMIELLKKFTSSMMSADMIQQSTGNPSAATDYQTLPSIPSSTSGASHPDTAKPSNQILKNKDTGNAAASNNPETPSTEDVAELTIINNNNNHEACNSRWPRDEVEALINLRCKVDNIRKLEHGNRHGGGQREPPLWERVSRGMTELGYKRSAKRCKEKWENVNKYFRKTKDVRKKRSAESRTCPYFRQLSTLYGGGKSGQEE